MSSLSTGNTCPVLSKVFFFLNIFESFLFFMYVQQPSPTVVFQLTNLSHLQLTDQLISQLCEQVLSATFRRCSS